MLQQTTVQAVKPFFAKFLVQWPTVQALAQASLDDILRSWAGLGYYSRARNLHACATAVVRDFEGRFPPAEADLLKLPGIGRYTAAAIAAIAFGQSATVVDGNVERVATRLYAVATPLPQAKGAVYAKMARLTPANRAGDFAQAMMDLGATICTPRSPACAICPVTAQCRARQSGEPTAYPVKSPKRERPVRYGTAYYVENCKGEVLVRTRPPEGLLGHMTELPGTAWLLRGEIDPSQRGRKSDEIPQAGHLAGRVKHVFTHFTLMLDVVACRQCPTGIADNGGSALRWINRADLQQEALPTLMRKAIELAQSSSIDDGKPPSIV